MRREGSARHLLWQSGRRDSYAYKVLRNRPETAPRHRTHLTTRRVLRKAAEAWLRRLRHTTSVKDRQSDQFQHHLECTTQWVSSDPRLERPYLWSCRAESTYSASLLLPSSVVE